ncbi:MAG: NAD(P)-dependent alcohol dehydrogenase [Caulobacterales bacterium]
MKAAILRRPGGLDKIEIIEAPKPSPKAGEVLMRVRASSLNYHDLLVANGGIKTSEDRILMSDGAGDIEAVGEGVTRFAPGDKALSVFFPAWFDGQPAPHQVKGTPGDAIDGYSAEYVCVSEQALTRMPVGYSYAEAATLPCAALTAWSALMVAARIKSGDWVLVQGTGGVSIFALQFAKAAGARVIATSSSDEKLARLKALGADGLINYNTEPKWGAAAKALTGGRGVDEVVEIGGAGTLNQSIRACRLRGHISLIGVLSGLSGEVRTIDFFRGQLTMTGIEVGSRKDQEDMIAALEATGIRPVIDQSFPLEDIAKAFQRQTEQKHFGKIVVEW